MTFPQVPFPEIFSDETGGNIKTLQSDYLSAGDFPIVDQGQDLVGGYTNDPSRLCKAPSPAIVFGDHTKTLKFIDFPFCLGADGTKILVPKIDADPKYLFHALHLVPIPDAGYSRHFKYLKSAAIPLPPLEEQRRIATILDQADALRRLRRHTLDRLNTLSQAIFHEMFGAELSYGKKIKLGELVEARSSLGDPTEDKNSELPHVGPEHIVSGSGQIDWTTVRSCADDGVTSGKYFFQEGDIIFSKIRPYLNKVAIADRTGMCSADMYPLHVPNSALSTDFLHFVLGSANFLAYAETVSNRANIPKINRKQLFDYETVVPEKEAQEEFTNRLGHLKSHRQAIHKSRKDICRLFASLQHCAFRGEL